MLIDDVQIRITSGSGGDGVVAFNKEMMSLGPTGGSGGRGGSVYVKGVSDLGALNNFRFKKEFKADDGERGQSQLRDGRDGEDLLLMVPVGTVVRNLETDEEVEITKIGEEVEIVHGGRGGRGNFHFRSATNTSPQEYEEGEPGRSFDFQFELKLIADVGFIGLPNVGKSSLLNELTNTKTKVANYPFTTLEPNLGVYFDLILADIPGLIEGASFGRGLGFKFLKHVEHTKVLFHFIAADSFNPVLDYEAVRRELKAYNRTLLEKPEYIFISKDDMASIEVVEDIVGKFKKINKEVVPISILNPQSINHVKKVLDFLISEKHKSDLK